MYEKKGFRPPAGLEVDQEKDNGKKYIGFIIEVSPNSEKRVRVLYENLLDTSQHDFSKYSLLFIKQPGTLYYPFSALLQTDGTYTVKNSTSTPFLYDGQIKGDKEISADLLRAK